MSCILQNDNSEFHDKSLKYENDRLKVALSSSSATSRKFEDEIHSLKSEKTLLNKALQESHSTREELKKQLQFYKEESNRLKNHNFALNSVNNSKRAEDFDNCSSSSTNSFNLNQNNKSATSKYVKHELMRLSENFDLKLHELNEIREDIRKLINDINQLSFPIFFLLKLNFDRHYKLLFFKNCFSFFFVLVFFTKHFTK